MLKNLHLVYGGEPLLTKEAIQSLKDKIKKADYNDYVVVKIIDHKSWESLLSQLATCDMFAEKRLFEVHLTTSNIYRKLSKEILQLAKAIPINTMLCFVTDKLTTKEFDIDWIKYINQYGQLHPCKPIPHNKWHQFVLTRFKDLGYMPNNDVLDYFANFYEGNISELANSLNILQTQIPKGQLNTEMALGVLFDDPIYEVFDLVDAILLQDQARILRLIKGLRALQIEPSIVLWAILREIRLFIRLKIAQNNQANTGTIASKLGIWSNKKPLYLQLIQAFSIKQLEQLIHQAVAIDNTIKGIKSKNVWDDLLNLALQCAGNFQVKMEGITI